MDDYEGFWGKGHGDGKWDGDWCGGGIGNGFFGFLDYRGSGTGSGVGVFWFGNGLSTDGDCFREG